MRADEYARFDALGLATLIGSGEVTADEVMGAARSQIAKCNPVLNAIIELYDSPEYFLELTGPVCRRTVLAQGYRDRNSGDAARALAAELFTMHHRSAMMMS